MGGWSNQIGHYEVSQMDYYYDGICEEGQTLEYYNSKTVRVKFTNIKTSQEKVIEVPLIELHDFVKDDGENETYSLSTSNEQKSLRNWLWNKLATSNIKVVSAFKLSINVPREYWGLCPDYYLNSKPLDGNVQISTNRVEFEIESLSVLDWLGSRGFIYA